MGIRSLPGARATVYLVDDDAAVRRALARVLRRADLEVVSFSSAEEFLGASHVEDGPSCLVVDLVLPGQSGLALQERMLERRLRMPVILISGRGDVGSGVRAM